MNVTGHTVLVTGGGSGIGRGLAETLHRAGNEVVIAGRRQAPLRAVADANPGMACRHLDLADRDSITRLAAELTDTYPGLDVLVNNAGVMHTEDLRTGAAATAEIAHTTLAINLLGPMWLTAALLPVLLARPQAAILNVTSALAFVPKAATPSYSASKAGLHAYTQSLRRQLRRTSVRVIEIIPPRVQTDMLADHDYGSDTMSLKAFVAETVSLIRSQPDAEEVVVGAAKRVRFAARDGHYDAIFDVVNP